MTDLQFAIVFLLMAGLTFAYSAMEWRAASTFYAWVSQATFLVAVVFVVAGLIHA